MDEDAPKTPAEHRLAAIDKLVAEGVPEWHRPRQGPPAPYGEGSQGLRVRRDRFPLAKAPEIQGPHHPDLITPPMEAPHLPAWAGDGNRHRRLVERAGINSKLRKLHEPSPYGPGDQVNRHVGNPDGPLPVAVRTEHQGD